MDKILSPDIVIDALGGTSEVARLCDIQPPSVSEWRHRGIPKAQLKYLQLARPDVFAKLAGEPVASGITEVHRRTTDPAPLPGHAGRQPASPHLILDTVPDHAVIVDASSCAAASTQEIS